MGRTLTVGGAVLFFGALALQPGTFGVNDLRGSDSWDALAWLWGDLGAFLVGALLVVVGPLVWAFQTLTRRGSITGDTLPWEQTGAIQLPPTISRTYSARGMSELRRCAQAEANVLAQKGYYRSSESYIEGHWGTLAWLVVLGLFLAPVVIFAAGMYNAEQQVLDASSRSSLNPGQFAQQQQGLVFLCAGVWAVAIVAGIYMLASKPTGTLTIIYQRQAPVDALANRANSSVEQSTGAVRDQLLALDRLRSDGLLRDAEYEAKRAEIIGQL